MRNPRSIARGRAASILALGLVLAACAVGPDLSAWQQCPDDTFCPAGTTCSEDGKSCLRNDLCGNAVADLDLGEECDDGNAVNGDGCDNNCTITRCGNGVVTLGEVCDDANTVDGDGCNNTCTRPVCGDCIVSPGESCDDGNVNDGDGCDSNCQKVQVPGLAGPATAAPSCPKAPALQRDAHLPR
jgi:cysteine-rich repeat protein